MRPTSGGELMDGNRDGYVCTWLVLSITGDTMRVIMDNDVPTPDGVLTEPEPYIGM